MKKYAKTAMDKDAWMFSGWSATAADEAEEANVTYFQYNSQR